MQDTQTVQDYRAILLAGTPLIDVRAPVEFQQGAMPGAINLPLMNDDERAAVGTCYKRQGPEAALALGHQLVCGETRQQRMKAWLNACRQNPAGYLCCARGGQRSHIVQQWLHESGTDYPLIQGGYKALRQAAIQLTEELVQKPIVLIGGCTGNGKTQLVQQQPNGVDLEGLAHHRGSSFGRTVEPQLSQASFENLLAVEMLKTDSRQDLRLWVLEDEGRMIGANHLPECLRERMSQPLLRWWTILLSYGWSDCAKSILCACTTISLTLMARVRAGRSTASICTTVCLLSAVVWVCNVLPS